VRLWDLFQFERARVPTVDLNEPLTLAWVFQEGAQWYGARHLTVGVDQQSLKARPSVTREVREFVSDIRVECAGVIAGAWLGGIGRRGEDLIAAGPVDVGRAC
jgi:hypothetical protein